MEIEFSTQVRVATGVTRESLDMPDGTTMSQLLAQLLIMHPPLANWIEPGGKPRPGLLVFVNDQAPTDIEGAVLKANDGVALMTLVSGG